MMKKMLFVTTNLLTENYGGSLGSYKAKSALSNFYDIQLYSTYKQANKFRTALRAIFGYLQCSPSDYINIRKELILNSIDIIYFDNAICGKIAAKIKKNFPSISLFVNFHNDEVKFHQDLVLLRGLKYIPLLFSAYRNQKASIKYADLKIFITAHDMHSVDPSGKNSMVVPVMLKDAYNPKIFPILKVTLNNYILFVGSCFHANQQATRYIITEILPKISCDVVIIGKGMEADLSDFIGTKRLHVYDYIEDLSSFYINAMAVIYPIIYGSGMKVKVAEAMMYGKKIIGSEEVFYGYDVNSTFCRVCKNIDDYLVEINTLQPNKKFWSESRSLFLKKYSSSQEIDYYKIVKKYEI